MAALGMVIGAGWMGARSMTSTAGPGISLMSEFTGLGYYAEVPAVIFDVQRVGPSTGLPTRTAQQDILSTAVLSHGDTKHPMLLPASVAECYTMSMEAFDLAERLQTPIFVMSDLDLGMNTWMAKPFEYPTKPFDRGKRLDADALKRLGQFARYRDVDGDGIPYRTVPGDGMPPYFVRGSGHNELAQYSERADDYAEQPGSPGAQVRDGEDARPQAGGRARRGRASSASSAGARRTGRSSSRATNWRRRRALATSYLRLRAYPFTTEVWDFVDRCDRVYVIEQNRDGQMLALLKMECTAEQFAKLRSIRHYLGLPIDGRSVTMELLKQERG